MEILGQVLRFALPILPKCPGFAFIAIFTLAVSIGANTVALGAFDAR